MRSLLPVIVIALLFTAEVFAEPGWFCVASPKPDTPPPHLGMCASSARSMDRNTAERSALAQCNRDCYHPGRPCQVGCSYTRTYGECEEKCEMAYNECLSGTNTRFCYNDYNLCERRCR